MAENTAHLDTIRAGYTFDGATLTLGAAVVDGQVHADAPVRLPLAMMNRHGLIAGATGTGKTKSLQMIAEQLSTAGVPVFLADVKGDLSGLATAGEPSDKLTARTQATGMPWQPTAYPVEFYALGGDGVGVPVRATVDSFGPLLLSRIMELNETQESCLQLMVHWADQRGLPLDDLADLKAVVTHLTSDEGKADLKGLGGVSKATANVILREVTGLQAAGMDAFFGVPEFETAELLRQAPDGRGVISCLELPTLQSKPQLFSTFMIWLLADLFAELPEAGDLDKPKLVFFLDEAHLLFDGASKAFLESITTTVRLIRSKGVGLFFVTQTPKDVPGDVLAQLANRVQHALRAFTPEDATALKATVRTFPNSEYDLEEVLTSAKVGEAVVTVMDPDGAPTPVALTRMWSPQSAMEPTAPEAMQAAVAASPLMAQYGTAQERESAAEKLAAQASPAEQAAQAPAIGGSARDGGTVVSGVELGDIEEIRRREQEREERARRKAEQPSDLEKAVGNFMKSAGTQIGREVVRSVFGTRRRSGGGLLGGLFR
ncbi:helicase HerA-like domain-containing protein [Micrococcus lacusdianchii]|uniref:helicase HerA-like domain-containing protein n=1 Tax=Micrococcus lacusdianchii TaxID=2915940 RepID=UPI0020031FDC|nr:helicase HerA-like domain-containing protein [Micrococcus sp. JXJ CY 30]